MLGAITSAYPIYAAKSRVQGEGRGGGCFETARMRIRKRKNTILRLSAALFKRNPCPRIEKRGESHGSTRNASDFSPLFRPIGSSRFVSLHRLDAQGSFHYFNEVIDRQKEEGRGYFRCGSLFERRVIAFYSGFCKSKWKCCWNMNL